MSIITKPKVLNRKFYWRFFYLILFFLIASCKNDTPEKEAKIIDSILVYDDTRPLTKAHNDQLNSIRNYIGKDDIKRLSRFYQLKFFYLYNNKDSLNCYADSAKALFKNKNTINKHKTEYFKSLLLKGDALYLSSKFSQAVLSYLEARSFREKNLDVCNNKQLAVSIGNVYYVQNKFLKAASYFKESYALEKTCKTTSVPLKHFYEIQGLLNNIGYCYEKAEMLDSAKHYYNEDLSFIDSLRNKKKIEVYALNDGAATVCDNLGSVYLKQGNLAIAEKYLLKSISIKYSGDSGIKTPPMIKLASLYTLKGNFKTASFFFNEAYKILKKQPNKEFESRWHQAKSAFYVKQNQYNLAYQHQEEYIKLKDSVSKVQAKLSSINIEKDFANLEQKYSLQGLEKKDALKNIYLIFIAFLLILVLMIVFLLKKNIKQSKENLANTKLQNTKLQEALKNLEEANLNYARIMKIMAHDLKNPLSGIVGISRLILEDDEFQKKDKDLVVVIKESADNALGMINEILNSSLFTNDGKALRRTNIDIQLVLAQCVSLLRFKAAEKFQRITLSSKKEVIVYANKEKLWQVFNNLIVNAIKFSPDHTAIDIAVEELSKRVIISVADNGIGIATENASKIFDIFTEAKRPGTAGEKAYGLGLSISKQIIDSHNGKIWFESNKNGGTTFYVRLNK